MKPIKHNSDLPYTSLVDEIGSLLKEARKEFAYTTNTILVKTYWKIGHYINLFTIRQFYIRYPKIQTVSELLTWSHYVELLKLDNPLELEFYTKQCENEH